MCCVNSIKVYPTALELGVGSWYYDAYAEVCPTDACCKCVEWHSDNPCVASVNPSNGYIYANSVGVAKIYATTTDGSGCSNYINIRVSETVPVRSIVVLPATITIEPGQTTTLSTTVLPKTASNKALIWTSSNEKVAIVDCNGVVTGIAGGTVSIIATAADGSGTSDACVVKVTGDVLVSSITFYHSSVNMLVGDSRYLWINVLPSDATNDSVCWSSSDTSVVTVNKNSGLVLAQGAGTATIYATACDGSGVVGTCTITVRDKIFVSSITVSPKTKKLNVNASATLSATVLPDNADDKRIRWSCEPSGIVSLNDVTGEIRGIGTGTTTVKAVACDGSGTCGSCKVTVVTVPVTGVSINPSSYKMTVGDSVRFSATLYPSNATNKSVIWSSSNPYIATVTSGGCVTANNIGDTTISVETIDGGKIDYCDLSVCAVDTREKVTIEKDDEGGYEFFKVTFKNGLVWKSVGYDLSNMDTWIPQVAKNRSNQNLPKTFSEEQIAFLYLFDPLGVVHYVEYYFLNHDVSLVELLNFKDRIYYQIFGETPKRFLIDNSGNRYIPNSSLTRDKVYTDSELIFGTHNIPDITELIKFSINLSLDLLSIWFPESKIVTWVARGATAVDLAFFGGSIVDAFTSDVAGALQNFIDKEIGKDPVGLLMWPKKIFDIMVDINEGIENSIGVPDTTDLTIYNKISRQTLYKVQFKSGVQNLFIEEILDLCSE